MQIQTGLPTNLTTNIAYLAGLSMAAERLVEIVRGINFCTFPKGPVPPTTVKDVGAENRRIAKVNSLAVIAGVATAAIAKWIHVLPADTWSQTLMYGLLAGAGSGFWNAVLSYLLQLKAALPQAPTEVVIGGRSVHADVGKSHRKNRRVSRLAVS